MARPKSKGLGDTIAKITEATGIDKAVKFIAGEDCGCSERKKKLNELFPYRQNQCLLEDEYNWLFEYFKTTTNEVTASKQMKVLEIYNRVFQVKKPSTSCSDCFRDVHNELKRVMKVYEDEILHSGSES
jgi:hypothetical protein